MEPSPMKAVVKKVIGSLICAFVFMKFATVYPIKSLKGKIRLFLCAHHLKIHFLLQPLRSFRADNDFSSKTSFAYKFWFIMTSTTVTRFKYYHAWLLADAICNNSGLGFNGYDQNGNDKWDLISNINVVSFEVRLFFCFFDELQERWMAMANLKLLYFFFSLYSLPQTLEMP